MYVIGRYMYTCTYSVRNIHVHVHVQCTCTMYLFTSVQQGANYCQSTCSNLYSTCMCVVQINIHVHTNVYTSSAINITNTLYIHVRLVLRAIRNVGDPVHVQ